jgi:hypothetical protein
MKLITSINININIADSKLSFLKTYFSFNHHLSYQRLFFATYGSNNKFQEFAVK